MDHNSKEEIPQFLKDLKSKGSGYKLPNDYFAKMQDSIISQVIEQETEQPGLLDNLKIWFQSYLKPQYAFASIATMILIGVFVGTGNDPVTVNDSFGSLQDTDLEYFLENEIDDLHDQDLMATLSADEIDFNNYSFPTISEDMTIPDEYIEDLDNNILIDFELED